MAKNSPGPGFQQVLGDLKKGVFAPVYLLHGEESFYIDDIASYIENSVLDETERDFNQVVLYGKDSTPKQVIDNARQFPMMAKYRVVILREAQGMKDFKDLGDYIANPSNQSIVVLCHKYKKLDGRSALLKNAQKNGVVFYSKKLYDNQIPNWISNRSKDYNLVMNSESAYLMAEFLGADLSKIDKELEKLSVVLGEGQKVEMDDVKKHIGLSKDYNSFELNNALAVKDTIKANRILNYFEANPKSTHITQIMGMLTNFFSKVFIVQQNFQNKDSILASEIGVSPFFIKDYRQAAKSYPKVKLIQIFSLLAEYDLRSKGVNNKSVSHSDLLKELIFKILH